MRTDFSSLIGNGHIKSSLSRPFHAYLITGAEGSGKHTLLRLLTQAYLCEGEVKPCGKCAQCVKFLADSHPDVMKIPPDIKLEDLRDALAGISYLPNDAEYRVVICDGAENLSVAAQNVLLKPIEEPPKSVIFILLTSKPEMILETVRSRCMTLRMAPVPEEEVRIYLDGKEFSKYTAEQKDSAAALSGGYIGKAKSVLSGEETELYSLCGEFAEALIKRDYKTLFSVCSPKKREDLKEFVDTLSRYFLLHLHSLDSGVKLPSCNPRVIALGQRRLVSLCRRLEELTAKLQYNVYVPLWISVTVNECLDAVWRYV